MNAVAGFLDDVADLVKPVLCGIVCLERATWSKPGPYDDKNDRVKKCLVFRIERAVDEYITIVDDHQERTDIRFLTS